MALQHTPHPLTFGVEIECIARITKNRMQQLVKTYTGQISGMDRQVLIHHVFKLLKQACITCRPLGNNPFKQYEYDNINSQWIIDDDQTITSNQTFSVVDGKREEDSLFSIELISRRMDLDDLEKTRNGGWNNDSETIGGIAEIGRVLKALKENEDIKFIVNDTCGLHVHIALAPANPRSLSEPFKTPTLRAFSMLATIFEPCINKVVAPHRVEFDEFCAPVSRALGSELRLAERLAKIRSQVSIGGIIEVMNPERSRSFAYNFQNMLPSEHRPRPRNTIEFRQHHGTLDFEEIAAWVKVVAGMVRLALGEGAQERCMMLAKEAEDGELTLEDFLAEIGRPDLLGYYEQKRVAQLTSAQ